jgi:hypothetical protein
MASHARSKAPKAAHVPGALLRTGLIVAAAGAALGVGGTTTASAASPVSGRLPSPVADLDNSLLADPGTSIREGVKHAVPAVTGPVKSLQLDPLANTGVDPLTNGIGTRVSDFKPVGTELVTGPITRGASLDDLPVVGAVARKLPGGW